MQATSGMLVLVVGPSGAGKDSIIRGAQQALACDARFEFPRRVVTRRADVAAEDHDSISERAFAREASHGEYAIWWKAHGNCYGIPASIEENLQRGQAVVFNCSRAALAEVEQKYAKVAVIEIQVPVGLLVERIVARGRESREQAIQRVSRDVPSYPLSMKVYSLRNDGLLADAVTAFCAILQTLCKPDASKEDGVCGLMAI